MIVAGSAQYIEPSLLAELFADVDDVVLFVKDREGRYTAVNRTLIRRSGMRDEGELLGRRADEVFPGELGRSFRQQDEQVMESGTPFIDRLELHLYPGRHVGWCLTRKLPLRGPRRAIRGVVGFSRDLHFRAEERAPAGVAAALHELESKLADRSTLSQLAAVAGMAPRSFERAVKRFFGVSAGDLIIKTRIDAACRMLLDTEDSIGEIAHACGYADHSAFTRQFRARVGVTPRRFRRAAADS